MSDVCRGCGKKLEISEDIYEKRDIGKQKWLILCDECYKIESEKDSTLELIKFIKGKTDKLCWKELDIVVDILEKRFENNKKKDKKLKLKIDIEEAKILFHYCEMIEDEWSSANTIKEYELQEKLENYIKKRLK